jgi:glycosyltransferase involved in cell wall biosynthesis
MKIAILGTRGIPGNYGGFEQFAEYLSVGLVKRGHDITVYNPSFHKYSDNEYCGVKIRKVFSPEKRIGASANFIYDYLCLKDALAGNFDIIYELGYHSNAPSYYLLKRQSPLVVTNMDGMEWQRQKWNPLTRRLIRRLEAMAVRKSDYLVADNPAIRDYYSAQYGVAPLYIPYGAAIVENFDESLLLPYRVSPRNYFLIIARLEPENNIEMVLDGFVSAQSNFPFVVVGNKDTKYGKYLQNLYKKDDVRFVGAIYDKSILDALRHFCGIYFHGHSVGGTNPSLLEAMAAQAFISAHNNPFNRVVLGDDALFFCNKENTASIIRNYSLGYGRNNEFVSNNLGKIRLHYLWKDIIAKYEDLFEQLLAQKEKR